MKSSIKATILTLLTATSLSISFINPHPAQANATGKIIYRGVMGCIRTQCYNRNKKQSSIVQPIYKLAYQEINKTV